MDVFGEDSAFVASSTHKIHFSLIDGSITIKINETFELLLCHVSFHWNDVSIMTPFQEK